MNKSVYFALILSVTILGTFECRSWAQGSCNSLLELTNVDSQSPILAEFLSGRAYERILRTQPKALSLVPDQIAAASEGTVEIAINENNIRTRIYVTKQNGIMDVKISFISFLTRTNGVRNFFESFFALGKRNPSLNMLFPRIIAAISSGLEKAIVADATLKTVSISGENVVNYDLTKQLRELGFEPERSNAFKLVMNSFRREGAYAIWFQNIALWTGLIDALPPSAELPIKLTKNAVIVFSGFRYRNLARDWKIEFKVQRPVHRHRGGD